MPSLQSHLLELPSIAGPQKIGPYEIHTIETGSFALDGGAMFGIVPKTIWSKTNPADELNRIEMRLRCLLLLEKDSAQKLKRAILIDNGMGNKWSEKYCEIYKVNHSQWNIESELSKKGMKPEDITDIIATHLHFDHMGGTTKRVANTKGQSELVATFPNAKIWVQKANWELAYNPNEKDRASYLKENYEIYHESSKLNLLETSYKIREEILPNIFVRISNGHTTGMQLVEIADQNHALIYCADAVPTATHIKIPYIMGYDCYPITLLEEKKILLKEAEERNMILFFEHCPRAEGATVSHDGKDFSLKQAYSFTGGCT